MRIALVTTEYVSQKNVGGGGLATYMHKTAKALKELGHDPVIFLTTSSDRKSKYHINPDKFNEFVKERCLPNSQSLCVARPKFFKKIKFFNITVFLFPKFRELFLYKFYFKKYCAIKLSREYKKFFLEYLQEESFKDFTNVTRDDRGNFELKNIEMNELSHEGQLLIEVPIFFNKIPKVFNSNFKTLRVFKKNLFRAPRIGTICRKASYFLLQRNYEVFKKFNQYGYACTHSFFINRAIVEFNKKNKIDIIHYTNLSGLALFRPANIPAIIRVSGIHRLWWRVNESAVNEEMRLQDQLEFDVLSTVEKVVVPSEVIKNEIIKVVPHLDISLIETPFVKNTLQFDSSVLKEYGLDNKKYVLFFGQVAPLKGVVAIAEMIHDFLNKYPDIYYVFVGQMYRYQGKNMDKYILQNAKKFSNRIIFIDRLQHQFLFPIIEKAELITLPSRMDNLPNACIESMFLGKIVIGSNGASFDQLIEDGKSGFLCEIDDPKSLLSKVEMALSLNDEQKKLIGLNAKKRIEKLNPELVTNELLNFYRSAISIHSKKKVI